MKAATGKYSLEQKKLLNGKISQFSYTADVREVLSARGHRDYAPSYIRLVVCELRNQDAIWDAVTQVLKNRKKAGDAVANEIRELVEAD